jgi:hypothetical protein
MATAPNYYGEYQMKICTKCGVQKPLSDFNKSNNKRGDGYQYYCKPCSTIEKRKWRNNNQLKEQNNRYKRKYGLDIEAVNALLSNQKGKCDICEEPIKIGENAHLDHCHTTGKIRGFLCQKCNHAIGLFGDSAKKLKSAQKYLEKYSEKSD